MRHLGRTIAMSLAGLLLALATGCGHQEYATLSVTARPLTAANIAGRLERAQHDVSTYQFTVTTTAGDVELGGFGDVRQRAGRVLAAHASVDLPGGRGAIESIQLGHTYFLKGLPTVRPWLRIDPRSKGALARQLLGAARASGDPTKSYDAFAHASAVTLSGRGPVGGVDTTHYRVSVPRSALALFPGHHDLLAQLPRTLHFDVWVDRDDLVRKLFIDYSHAGHVATISSTLTDYGKPVHIGAPRPGLVTSKLPSRGQQPAGSLTS